MFTTASTTADKLVQMFAAILLFAAVVGVILFIAGRFTGRRDKFVAYLYLAPVVLMLSVGLLYPGLRTIYESFFDAAGKAFILDTGGVPIADFVFTLKGVAANLGLSLRSCSSTSRARRR